MKTVLSWLAAGVLVAVAAIPLGPLPALGPTFNPGTGVAASYAGNLQGTLRLPGLEGEVTVQYDAFGVPHIFAGNPHDLFFAQGYVVARERLVQMDVMRRQAGGRLAEILGPTAVKSDAVELALGLRPVAEATATRMAQEDPEIFRLVEAYAAGVNAWIQEARRTHRLPPFFRLLQYEPEPWTAVDTFLIQGALQQNLAFSIAPLQYEAFAQAFGQEPMAVLLPPVPVTARLPFMAQQPYHQGPFPQEAVADVNILKERRLDLLQTVLEGRTGKVGGMPFPGVAATVMGWVDNLGELGMPREGHSNNWAVAPQRSASGHALLAGDPHLKLTLPAIWFEVQLAAPGLEVYGVSIPGTPGVIIGRSAHVAWSLTNTTNQQVFYYRETVEGRGERYFHEGEWKDFAHYRPTIPVRGGGEVQLDIRWSVHGPVVSDLGPDYDDVFPVPPGDVISLAYTGNLYALDIKALYLLMQARNAAQVKEALNWWGAPTQNFAYATADGDIGIISAGYYPVVDPTKGAPWRVLDGTGESDWQGLIPYAYIPQTENPPWGFVWSANQRNMPADYPYYVGVSGFWVFGSRSQTIYETLAAHDRLTVDDMAALQLSVYNALAARTVPVLVETVAGSPGASPQMKKAAQLLQNWNFRMDHQMAAPALWQAFIDHYIRDIFGPWWTWGGLQQRSALELQPYWFFLLQAADALTYVEGHPEDKDLVDERIWSWLKDPLTGEMRSVRSLLLQALSEAVQEMESQHPGVPLEEVQWGWYHTRSVPSLLEAKALGIPPYPADGGPRVPGSDHASWRMVVEMPQGGPGWAMGIYPGGESEDPASPHYKDEFSLWRAGLYKPLWLLPEPVAPGTDLGETFRESAFGQNAYLAPQSLVQKVRQVILRP
ncbi:MAG: penicillin acylase family protein [Bacillota bacterium]|nr:penicillin acylase family protein [Bacillota bacterium]